jgi:hypothetical protein
MRAIHETTSRSDPHPHPGRPAHRAARGLRIALGAATKVLLAALLSAALAAAPAQAASAPHYDVPRGFTRCPDAKAWHGFFKWASADHATCTAAARFMRAYAGKADGAKLPTRVDGYTCRIFYWRNSDGDVYASRHTCTRGAVTVRFYGEV